VGAAGSDYTLPHPREKKEDIICRAGELSLKLWPAEPAAGVQLPSTFMVPIDSEPTTIRTGRPFALAAGSRVTLVPGVWHEFSPASSECVIGEVSTANDDTHDNFFLNPEVGRFPGIEEDEPAMVQLVSRRLPEAQRAPVFLPAPQGHRLRETD
jgi:hypothetical protein